MIFTSTSPHTQSTIMEVRMLQPEVSFEWHELAANIEKEFPDCVHRPISAAEYKQKKDKGTPIVIDLGTYRIRAGYADESEPRLILPCLLGRAKSKAEGQGMGEVVGHHMWDTGKIKMSLKRPFEREIVTKALGVERLLDYVFTELGLGGQDSVDHPVVITEPALNPSICRAPISDLLLTCYKCPYVCFGIDFLFSFGHHLTSSSSSSVLDAFSCSDTYGLIISSDYEATHVMPVLAGSPDFSKCRRLTIGGHDVHEAVLLSMSLRYPLHRPFLGPQLIQKLVYEHCVLSEHDYQQDLASLDFMDYKRASDGKVRKSAIQPVRIQLPQRQTEDGGRNLTQAELSVREARRLANQKRFRDMLLEQRNKKLGEKRAELAKCELMLAQVESGEITEHKMTHDLRRGGFRDRQDFIDYVTKLQSQVVTLESNISQAAKKPAPGPVSAEDDDRNADDVEIERLQKKLAGLPEEYPLAEANPKQLGPDEAKQHKIQRLCWMGAIKRIDDKLGYLIPKREQEKAEEVERLKDPAAFNLKLREQLAEVRAKREERVQHKRTSGAQEASGGGQGDSRSRRNQTFESIEQRKLAAQLLIGNENGKLKRKQRRYGKRGRRTLVDGKITYAKHSKGDDDGELGFGDSDDDWDIYRKVRKMGDGGSEEEDTESEEERDEIETLEDKLMEHDEAFVAERRREAHAAHEREVEHELSRRVLGLPAQEASSFFGPEEHTDMRFTQMLFYVDRIRGPECLYQPFAIRGKDEAGLGETIARVLRDIPLEERTKVLQNVYVTGGNTKLRGFETRLRHEMQMLNSVGTEFTLHTAQDAQLDAWYGARAFAEQLHASDGFAPVSMTLAELQAADGKGEYVKVHPLGNPCYEFERPVIVGRDRSRDKKRRR